MLLERGPIPLYYQVEQDLRTRIGTSEFAPGAALPREEDICAEYNVSRITVRRALDELIARGLIIKRRGIGSFVAARKSDRRTIQLTGSLSEFLATAEALDTKVISIETIAPTATVTTALSLKPNETVMRVQILASLEALPVGLLDIYVPSSVGALIDVTSLQSGEVVIRRIERLLARRIMRAEQVISAGRAGQVAGAHLHLSPNAPTLKATRVYFDRSGKAIELVIVNYHPDRYAFNVEFITR